MPNAPTAPVLERAGTPARPVFKTTPDEPALARREQTREKRELSPTPVQEPAPTPLGPAHETTARAYGERAAGLTEWLPVGWDVVAHSLANGWSRWHGATCGCAEDWRLSFPLIKEGWLAARAPA